MKKMLNPKFPVLCFIPLPPKVYNFGAKQWEKKARLSLNKTCLHLCALTCKK